MAGREIFLAGSWSKILFPTKDAYQLPKPEAVQLVYHRLGEVKGNEVITNKNCLDQCTSRYANASIFPLPHRSYRWDQQDLRRGVAKALDMLYYVSDMPK